MIHFAWFKKSISLMARVSERNSFRANKNYSELFDSIRDFYAHEFEVNFQSELIGINSDTDWFSIRMNQCLDWFGLNIRFRSVCVRIDYDNIGLKIYFRFIRIEVLDWVGWIFKCFPYWKNPRVIFGRGKHEEIREDFQIPRGNRQVRELILAEFLEEFENPRGFLHVFLVRK